MNREQLVQRLHGTFPAAITPLTAEGDVDHEGLTENLQWMKGYGFAGYLLLGSTGEQVHLSEFERALVLEIARRHIGPDEILMAGTGLAGTRITIEETKRAAEAGTDVALVVTPNYYQKAMTAGALTDHYRAIADESPIPIMLYSVPGITGVTMPAAVVAELAAHPNVVGMKNSGNDAQVAAAYRDAAGEESFVILAGSPYAAPGFLLAGLADGAILGVANVLPASSVALVEAARQGDVQAVGHHARRLREASEQIGRFGISGWKAGVELLGHRGGPARSPLRNVSEAERQTIQEILARLR